MPNHTYLKGKKSTRNFHHATFRTHSVLGNQYPEFSVWIDKKLQSKSHSCHTTADGIFNGMKDCIFSALSSTRKRGDEVLFRKHAMTSKEGCIRWRVFWICPKPDLGDLSSVTLYISWDNIAVYPKTNLLTSPRTNSQKCLLKYTIPGGGIHSMRMIRHKWKRRPIVPTHMADASKVKWEPGRSHSQIKSNQIWAQLSHSSIKRQWWARSSSSFFTLSFLKHCCQHRYHISP